MNNKFLTLMVALLAGSTYADQLKKPVTIGTVSGKTPAEYVVLQTTVQRDVSKPKSTPTVITAEVGRFGRTNPSLSLNKQIVVPLPEFTIKSDIPEYLGTLASSMQDPRAQLAGVGAAIVLKEGMRFIGSQINDAYGNDPYTLSFLQIAPSKYYQVNKGQVLMTETFKQDVAEYLRLSSEYVSVVKEFNEAIKPYNKLYQQWVASSYSDFDLEDQLETLKKKIDPIIRKRVEYETKFETYALHRMVIMPNPIQPKGNCGFSLLVYTYLGSKQTNVYTIDYCVQNPSSDQTFNIQVVANVINTAPYDFKPGGFKILVGNNATLTNGETEKESRLLAWGNEAVVGTSTDFIAELSFPFDIVKMKMELEQIKDAKKAQDFEFLNEILKATAARTRDFKPDQEKLQRLKTQIEIEEALEALKPVDAEGASELSEMNEQLSQEIEALKVDAAKKNKLLDSLAKEIRALTAANKKNEDRKILKKKRARYAKEMNEAKDDEARAGVLEKIFSEMGFQVD